MSVLEGCGLLPIFQILERHLGLPLQEPAVPAGWPGRANPEHSGSLEEDGCRGRWRPSRGGVMGDLGMG